jgi:hypothetical protein
LQTLRAMLNAHVKEVKFLEQQIKTLIEGIRKSFDAQLRVLANKVVLEIKQHSRENELKNLKAATGGVLS